MTLEDVLDEMLRKMREEELRRAQDAAVSNAVKAVYSRPMIFQSKVSQPKVSQPKVSQHHGSRSGTWKKILKYVVAPSVAGMMLAYTFNPAGLDYGRKGFWAIDNYRATRSLAKKDYDNALTHFRLAGDWQPEDCQTKYNVAEAYYLLKRYDESENKLHEVLHINPAHQRSHILLGDIYDQKGYKEMARYSFEMALKLDPDDIEIMVKIGWIDIQNGLYHKAIATYEHALEVDPDSVEVLAPLGAAYCKVEDYERSIDVLRRAIQLDPDNEKLYSWLGWAVKLSGNTVDAEKYFRRAVELDPNSSRALNALAVLLDDYSDKIDEAENLYKHSLSINPEDAVVLTSYAMLLENKGRKDAASEKFRQAIDVDPTYILAYSGLERLLADGTETQRFKLYQTGIENFTKELEKNPSNLPVIEKLAEYYEIMGQYDNAEKYRLKAMSLAPDDIDVMVNIGWKNIDNGLYPKAIATLEHALEVDPDSVEVLIPLGVAYCGMEDYERSIAVLSRAIQLDPDNVSACGRLGWTFKLSGNIADAEKYLRRAVELEPDGSGTLGNLASLMADDPDMRDEAEKLYLRSLTINPQSAYTLTNLARLLEDKGRKDAASEKFRQAIDVDPVHVSAYSGLERLLANGTETQRFKLYQTGIENFTKELEKNPSNLPVIEKLAEYYELMGQYDDAEKYLLRAISLAPDDESLKIEWRELHKKTR